MFQDEARFGRMVRIRRCWARKPQRPTVDNGYEREFLYVYGAVSPMQGELDWMITEKMNTHSMSEFLARVSAAHRRELRVDNKGSADVTTLMSKRLTFDDKKLAVREVP